MYVHVDICMYVYMFQVYNLAALERDYFAVQAVTVLEPRNLVYIYFCIYFSKTLFRSC